MLPIDSSEGLVYFASEDLIGQANHPGRKLLPIYLVPRDKARASEPWYDNPAEPLLGRPTGGGHGDFQGRLSSKLIDDVLVTTFGKPGASAKCNAALVVILKALLGTCVTCYSLLILELVSTEEAGIHNGVFRWAILGRTLFENRLRWVGWPVEINHDPKPHDRPAGIPGSLRAGEMHLLKRVLARRFPPYLKSGLRLVKWDSGLSIALVRRTAWAR